MHENFSLENLQGLALCLARQSDASFNDVIESLYGSGVNFTDGAPFTHNLRSSTIAACFYLLYSEGQNVDHGTKFLLDILAKLPHLRWIDDAAFNKTDSKLLQFFNLSYSLGVSGITIYEYFMFCFNTGLTDIAAHFPRTRDVVVKAQLKLIKYLVHKVLSFCESEKLENDEAGDQENNHGSSHHSNKLEARGSF